MGQLKQAEAASGAQLIEQERQQTAALALEAAAARQELTTSTAEHRQALDEERARRAAMWSELAVAQRKIETQATQLRKAGEETVQLKQAVDSATMELRQSLQQEHDRAEALATELAKVRRAVEAAPLMPAPLADDTKLSPTVSWLFGLTWPTKAKTAEPGEPARVEHKPRGGYGCQHFRTYDPASGTYMGYDGRRHSCP